MVVVSVRERFTVRNNAKSKIGGQVTACFVVESFSRLLHKNFMTYNLSI